MCQNKVFVFIKVMIFLSTCAVKNEHNKYEHYLPVKGVITYVRPARLTSHGMVATKYDLRFIAKDGKEYSHVNCNIVDKSYSVHDTLTIYYNPENPNDPITDEKVEKK